MTLAEIDELKAFAGRARKAQSTLSAMLAPLSSSPANAELSILSDFLRNVENTITAAGDVIKNAESPNAESPNAESPG